MNIEEIMQNEKEILQLIACLERVIKLLKHDLELLKIGTRVG